MKFIWYRINNTDNWTLNLDGHDILMLSLVPKMSKEYNINILDKITIIYAETLGSAKRQAVRCYLKHIACEIEALTNLIDLMDAD